MVFQPTGESTTVPAPIGGLNTRDAPDMMEQSEDHLIVPSSEGPIAILIDWE